MALSRACVLLDQGVLEEVGDSCQDTSQLGSLRPRHSRFQVKHACGECISVKQRLSEAVLGG